MKMKMKGKEGRKERRVLCSVFSLFLGLGEFFEGRIRGWTTRGNFVLWQERLQPPIVRTLVK